MDSTFSPRPATAEDLALLVEIEKKIHVAPWTEEHFRSELAKPFSRVMVLTDDETDSVIAGYIVFWLMFDECQILNVGVDLPHRGQGLAKKLIRMAIQMASDKGLKKAFLDVRKSNGAAIQLYQGQRFSITQVRKGYYSNGEDAYEMTLYIDAAFEGPAAGMDF